MELDKRKLQNVATQARERLSDKLGDLWWFLLIRGLLAVAVGVVALFWPKATLVLLIRLIGLYVLFDGIVSLLGVYRSREFGSNLAPGLISVVIGLILLFWPDVTGRLLLVIVGIWALIQGVVLFLAGRQTAANDPARNLKMTIGVGAAIVGLILFIWPGTGAVAISWAIGIAALLIGALLIYLALRLRQANQRVDNLKRT